MPDGKRSVRAVAALLLAAGIALAVAGSLATPERVERHLVSDHDLGERNRSDLAVFARDARRAGVVLALLCIPFLVFADRSARWLARKREALLGFGILLVTVVLLAAAGEVVLRLLIGEQSHGIGGQDPATLKMMRSIALNDEGFRDRPWSDQKEEGTFRILFLGDSFTFGAGVRHTDSLYVRHVEAELNARGDTTKFVALNAGFPGWNTKQEVDFLEERGLALRPDVAVLAYVLNDAEEESAAYREISLLPEAYERRIKSRSYLYYFVVSRIHRLCERTGLVDSYQDYLIALYRPGAAYGAGHRAQFARFARVCRENGVKPLLVLWPIFFEMDRYPFREAHRFVREAAEENGIPALDLLDLFRGHTTGELIVNPYDYHPNEKAHRMAAGEICRWMDEVGALP